MIEHGTPARLQSYLSEYAARYPTAWRDYDMFVSERGKALPRWPDWCWCPLAAAETIVSCGGDRPKTLEMAEDIGCLGALAVWRITRGIYRFDKDLFGALWDTPIEGDLPIEVLYRLPEWCVYVEVPAGMTVTYSGQPICGWFAHLEWDANTKRPEFRIVIDAGGKLTPFPVHLLKKSLDECLRSVMVEGCKQFEALFGADADSADAGLIMNLLEKATGFSGQLAALLTPLVSVTLYLCAEAADIADLRGRREKPENPQPVKTKRGARFFPASTPTAWQVGFRIGAALRRAYAETASTTAAGTGHHASPRPHVRRAHWHAYWTGPKSGDRRIVLKWLPPIPVGAGELIPTIHPVNRSET